MTMRILTLSRLFSPRVIRCPAAFLEIANTPPVLSPTFNDDNPLPSIPAIRSNDIRTRVFTHRSFYARPGHIFEDQSDDPSPDNEKYELLGDTVLGLVVTDLLLDMYPNLRVGPSSDIRALIVCNHTLAAISLRYALPAQLRLHSAQENSLRTNFHIQGTYTPFCSSRHASYTPYTADLFESYVGGLYLDQGLAAVKKWLKVLFKPYTNEAYIRVRTKHGLPPLPRSVSPQLTLSTVSCAGSSSSIDATSLTSHSSTPSISHLAFFNEQLLKDKREAKFYDDYVAEGAATIPIWAARVEVDGEVFGHGKGSTKKAARNEAAKKGLVRMNIVV